MKQNDATGERMKRMGKKRRTEIVSRQVYKWQTIGQKGELLR